MTTGFSPDLGLSGPPPDPTKHVDYSLGMILGVDEFTQEFAYLSERDRWGVRDLAGYGTVWGLRVGTRMNGAEPEVSVAPGVAVSPRGRLIRVTPSQCAGLNAWLKAHTEELQARGLPPLGTSTDRVFVVLSYRECETDLLPIPGEPCRNEADTLKPSRITDDFRLELRFAPPDQTEEDALRDFAHWLRAHVEVTSTPGSSIGLEAFKEALRAAVVAPPLSPPAWPPFSPGSPPDFVLDESPPAAASIFTGDLPEYLRAAFLLWVTELRPLWRPNWLGEIHSCTGALAPETPSDGDSLLLAELRLPLTRALGDAQWFVAASPGPDPLAGIEIHEEQRPFLLSTRLLQEWLVAGEGTGSAIAPPEPTAPKIVAAGWVPADPAAPSSGSNQLRAVAGPAPGQVAFTFDGIEAPAPGTTGKYVVHAMLANAPPPAAAPPAIVSPSLTFVGVLPASGPAPIRFVLQLTSAGVPVATATLNQLFFTIQVTQLV